MKMEYGQESFHFFDERSGIGNHSLFPFHFQIFLSPCDADAVEVSRGWPATCVVDLRSVGKF